MVVLGLLTSKKGALEKKDDVKRRIDAATKYIDLVPHEMRFPRNAGLPRQCSANLLTEDQEFAKLALVVEIAKEVWGE